MPRMKVSQTGTGESEPVVLDIFGPPEVGFGAVISGTVTYTVQHTFDNVLDADVTPTWFDHSSVSGSSANAFGDYQFPVAALRINVSSGSGTVTLTALQSGPR